MLEVIEELPPLVPFGGFEPGGAPVPAAPTVTV
jgi:hypothetical protein